MKLLISSLASVILAHGSLVNAYSYNGYVNRQLEKAPGNLFRNRLAKYKRSMQLMKTLAGCAGIVEPRVKSPCHLR